MDNDFKLKDKRESRRRETSKGEKRLDAKELSPESSLGHNLLDKEIPIRTRKR